MGYAVVRVAARGFIWLQSSTPRVSDVEKLGRDEKINMSEKVLKDFIKECRSVEVCYEVVIVCVEEAMALSEYNNKKRLESKDKKNEIEQEALATD